MQPVSEWVGATAFASPRGSAGMFLILPEGAPRSGCERERVAS